MTARTGGGCAWAVAAAMAGRLLVLSSTDGEVPTGEGVLGCEMGYCILYQVVVVVVVIVSFILYFSLWA